MKEGNNSKLKRLILTAFLLFLTLTNIPASNRSTCPTFGSKSMNTISHTALFNNDPQVYVVRIVQLKVVMRLTSPVPFRSDVKS